MSAIYTAAGARRFGAPEPFACACCRRPTAKRTQLWLVGNRWQCSRCFLALDGRPIPDACRHRLRTTT